MIAMIDDDCCDYLQQFVCFNCKVIFPPCKVFHYMSLYMLLVMRLARFGRAQKIKMERTSSGIIISENCSRWAGFKWMCIVHRKLPRVGGKLAKVVLVQLDAEKQKNQWFHRSRRKYFKKMCDKFWCVYKRLNTQPFTTSGESELCVFCVAEPNHCSAWRFFSSYQQKTSFQARGTLWHNVLSMKNSFRILTTQVSGFSPFMTTLWEGFKCGHMKNKLKVFIVLIIPNPDHSA